MFSTLILERFSYSVIHLRAILNSSFFKKIFSYWTVFKFHICEHLADSESNSQHLYILSFNSFYSVYPFTSVTLFKLTLGTIFTGIFFILQLHFSWVIIYSPKVCLVVEIVVYLYQCQVKPRISKTDHQGRYNFPT